MYLYDVQPVPEKLLLQADTTLCSYGNTMVSVSTVKPSMNLEFLHTYKNLEMSLFTLFKKPGIYRFSCMKSYA